MCRRPSVQGVRDHKAYVTPSVQGVRDPKSQINRGTTQDAVWNFADCGVLHDLRD